MSSIPGSMASGSTDGSRLQERVLEVAEELRRYTGDCDLDLYYRDARTIRVARHDGEPAHREVKGHDEGLAVRVHRRSDGASGFAACTGLSPASARHTLTLALSDLTLSTVPWTVASNDLVGSYSDHDPLPTLPSSGALVDWLDRATDDVLSLAPARCGQPVEARVEAIHTNEVWHGTWGLNATRSRCRAWAILNSRPGSPSTTTPRPLMTSSRSWEGLDPSEWSRLLADRWMDGARRSASGHGLGRTAVLVAPEAAAILVTALVQTCQSSADRIGRAVGPGWSLEDRPLDDHALFGGSFDDCCFPTANRELADGRRIGSVIQGAGHQRRPSFRDRPTPRHSHLAVSPPSGSAPSRCLVVTGLSIHPLTARAWAIEFDGGLLTDGGVAGAVRGFLQEAPETLVERCVAGIGPARASHHGVTTPALLFEDLQAQLD